MAITSFKYKHEFLSNFYPSPLKNGVIVFKTVEHYFQACKTVVISERKAIVDCDAPWKAKRLGRQVTLVPNWNEIRDEVMRTGVYAKFKKYEHLRNMLLATGNEELVEGNDWGDTYWGVCRGKGENKLGIILMEVRDLLKKD